MKLIQASNSYVKTPKAITVIVALFLCVYFICVWFYFGEFDLSKYQWLKFVNINNSQQYFDPKLLALTLPPFGILLIFAWVLNFVKKQIIGLDILVILSTLIFFWNVTILTGLMNDAWLGWIVFARVVIVFITTVVFFLISNKLFNVAILRSRFANSFGSQQYNEIVDKETNKNELIEKWNRDRTKKSRFIEIPISDNNTKCEELKK